MIPFRSQPPAPRLPEGYRTETEPPLPGELNVLLMACGESRRDEQRLALVLERSAWQFCVRDPQGRLVGFVRATSDQALNANLWDLSASPRDPQRSTVLAVLVHSALTRLRRELSGCSISVAAPPEALSALQQHGFMVDPGGIRAMGLVLAATEASRPGEPNETSMEGLEPPTFRTGI